MIEQTGPGHEIVDIAPVPRTFRHDDTTCARAKECLRRTGDHGGVRVDRAIALELDEIRLEKNPLVADVDLEQTRYLLVDRRRDALTEDELGQLTFDAFHASIPRLRNAIAAFRRELGSAPDRAPG